MNSNLKKRHSIIKLAIAFLLLIVFPLSAHAALNDIQDLIKLFTDFNIDLLLPLAFSAGLLFFMWRGAVYIFNSQSEEGKTEGKRILTWGIIALFLMVSVWGIIKFFQKDAIGDPIPMSLPILNR